MKETALKMLRTLSVVALVLVSLTASGASRTAAVNLTALPSVIATVGVGSEPHGVAVDETRNLVYVSNKLDGTNKVTKIDGFTPSVFSGAVSQPMGVAVDSGGNRIIVANNDNIALSILKGADGTLAVDPPPNVGPPGSTGPVGVAFNASTGKAYVANFNDGALYRVNLADNNVKRIPVDGMPLWVALDASRQRAYVTIFDRHTVAVIDTATDEKIAEWRDVYGEVTGIAVNTKNGDVYVANQKEGAVTVVDSTGAFKGLLAVGNQEPFGQPVGVAFNPNTDHVFVNRYDTDQVYVFNAASVGGGATVSAIAQIDVQDGPELGIAVNTATNRVYVANKLGNTVSVISDPKTLNLSSNVAVFLAQPSGTASSQTVVVDSSPSVNPLSWSASTSYTSGSNMPAGLAPTQINIIPTWITVSPTSGSVAPTNVAIGVNTSGLGLGTYTGKVRFSTTGVSNSPQDVDVTLVITTNILSTYVPVTYK